MEQKSDLKMREWYVWNSFFRDGFWDISLGLMLITIGIRAITDDIWFTMLFLVSVLVVTLGKSMITIPRLLEQDINIPSRKQVGKTFKFIGLILLLLIVIMELILAGNVLSYISFRAYIQGMGIAVFFGLIANFMKFSRLYIYGIVFAVVLVMWEVLGAPTGPYVALISGGIILIIGFIFLFVFLNRYKLSNITD